MENYIRVIPRDFFNESKLLKCLGQFELILQNQYNPIPIETEFDGDFFNIQLMDEGYLYCANYYVYLFNNYNDFFTLVTPYNSKSSYPLEGIYKGSWFNVLNEQGNLILNLEEFRGFY